MENFIEKKTKEFEEEFSRANLQTGEKEPYWFFPETIRPRDVSDFFRSALTETYAQARREAVEECIEELPLARKLCSNPDHDEHEHYEFNENVRGWNECRDKTRAALEKLKVKQSKEK